MEIIKSSADISLVFKEGNRFSTSGITIITMKNEKQHDRSGRVAFIAGKKLGNAVWRNRAKRRMRSICRDINGVIPQYDVVYLARSRINDISYEKLVQQTARVLEKTGLDR